MNKLSPFHLAIPVKDLKKAKTFYKDILGLEEGRSSNHWVDFNFFGHQLVIHFDENSTKSKNSNPVDGKDVPIPHFGIILEWEMFNEFSQKLKNKNVNVLESILPLLLRNYVDNQLIIKLLSQKFEIDINDYSDDDKRFMEDALELLKTSDIE